MKYSLEIPTSLLKKIRPYTDFDYALGPRVLEDKKYARTYANRGQKFLILDNGANELGVSMHIEELLRAAEILNPDLIVAPDHPGDMEATIKAFKEFREYDLPYGIMGVVQGETIEEVMACAIEYFTDDRVRILGVPCDIICGRKVKLAKMSATRRDVVTALGKFNFPIHLLGVSLPEELVAYKDVSYVDSVDTGTPILYALKGARFGEGKSFNKTNFLDLDATYITRQQFEDIYFNIFYLQKCMGSLN